MASPDIPVTDIQIHQLSDGCQIPPQFGRIDNAVAVVVAIAHHAGIACSTERVGVGVILEEPKFVVVLLVEIEKLVPTFARGETLSVGEFPKAGGVVETVALGVVAVIGAAHV